MHISLRCVIQKIPPSWKPPSLLVDPVIKPAPSVWKNSQRSKTQGFRASIGFPFMRCSTLSWLHSKVLRFAQRGASVKCQVIQRGSETFEGHHSFGFLHLLLLIPRLWESTALAPDLSLQTTPFKNKNIPHLSSNIFMDRFCPDLNKFPVFPCQTQNKKSPCFISNSCNCKFMLSYRCALTEKKTWSSTRRGGSADWSCCLDTNPSRGGQEQKSWSGTILHSNIWRFWTSCSKEMHVCWRYRNLRNHLSDIEATRILGSLAAFIWISARRPSISWCRWLEKKQLVTGSEL